MAWSLGLTALNGRLELLQARKHVGLEERYQTMLTVKAELKALK